MFRTLVWMASARAAELAGGFWLVRHVRQTGRRHVVTLEEAPHAEVAVVLGCRVGLDGQPMPMLEDRLQAALDLVSTGRAQRVLVSGGPAEVDAMERWMLDRELPTNVLIRDRKGYRTQATVDRAAKLVGRSSLLFCTQRFHAARTAYLANRAGLDARVVVADRRRYAHMRRNEARESLARMRAVLDGTLTRRQRP